MSQKKYKIGIISCCGKKRNIGIHQAKYLYLSSYFKKCYKYMKIILEVEDLYIFSAKYGLIHENSYISSYNASFKNKTHLISQNEVKKQFNIINKKADIIYYILGKSYINFLNFVENNKNIILFKNKRIGERGKIIDYEIGQKNIDKKKKNINISTLLF